MHSLHYRSLPFLLFLCFGTNVSASAAKDDSAETLKPCTAHNAANGNFYDLSKITVPPLQNHKKAHKDDRDESWHARGWDYGTNFTMNICAPVIESLKNVDGIRDDLVKNVSAFYTQGDKTISIGQSSTVPIFRGRKLVLNYTDGSPCDSTLPYLSTRKLLDDDEAKKGKDHDDDDDDDRRKHPSDRLPSKRPDIRRKSTLISFLCEHDSLAPKNHLSFIGASPDECTYFFEAKTVAACGGVIAPQQSVGPWGVFAVIGLIAAAVYLLGGIAYQRNVMHQRGWRQLPNYALWAGIATFLMDIVIILTSSCARFMPRRRGYNHLSSGRGRRDDEANGLIDSYEEEY